MIAILSPQTLDVKVASVSYNIGEFGRFAVQRGDEDRGFAEAVTSYVAPTEGATDWCSQTARESVASTLR